MSNDNTTEAIVDALVNTVTEFTQTDEQGGGCAEVMDIVSVYWGDPGVVPPDLMPAFLIMPTDDEEDALVETTGYEVRDVNVYLTLIVDAREYFDKDAMEATGDRKMVQVMDRLSKWLRTNTHRNLDGLNGVRNVKVPRTQYFPQVRGTTVVKSAQITAAVNMQRPRQR